MPEQPIEILIQAEQLEIELRTQQAELVAQQKALQQTLQRQIALEKQRLAVERERESLRSRMAAEYAYRKASTFHWVRQALGLLPVALILVWIVGLGDAVLGAIGAVLLAVQIGAYVREKEVEQEK